MTDDINRELGRLSALIETLQADVHEARADQKEMRVELAEISQMASKYRGAFGVILALGGALGGVATWFGTHFPKQ